MKNSIKMILVFLLLILFVSSASASNLSGYVWNSLEYNIAGVRVDFNDEHTFTDSSGYYKFNNVSDGNYTILTRQIGYRNDSQVVEITNNTLYNVTLKDIKMPAQKVPGFETYGVFLVVILLYIIRRKIK